MSSTNFSSAAEPNYAQILLPPGLTLDQYFALQREIVTIGVATSCAVAMGVWDYFNLLPLELALYRDMDKRMWMTPTTWAFVVLRYSAFIALLSGLWFTTLQNQHCQIAASFSQAGVVLVTGSAGIIFSYRVFSIWQFNKLVCVPVGLLYLLMVGCWLAVATQLGAAEGPHAEIGSNCLVNPVPAWSPIGFGSSVAFDTVVLILTIIGLRNSQTNSRIGRLLLNDNLIYFVLVTITNLVVLVIQSSHNDLLKPVVLPYPTLITTTMGSRVFLNLRLMSHHRGRSTGETSIPLSSTSVPSTALNFPTNQGPSIHYENGDPSKIQTHVRIDHAMDIFGPGREAKAM